MRTLTLLPSFLPPAPESRDATATAERPMEGNESARLLVIGDLQRLMDPLRQAGWTTDGAGRAVDGAADGPTGRALAAHASYDLIILDALSRDLDAPALCSWMRANGVTGPILILGSRVAEDIVAGLDAGADAYVSEPVGHEELRVRVAALLRRRGRGLSMHVRDLTVDLRRREARRAGRTLALTDAEYATLAYLACHSGHVVTRAQLAARLGDAGAVGPTTVDCVVTRVRDLVDRAGADPLIAVVGDGLYTIASP